MAFIRSFSVPNPHLALQFECTFRRIPLRERKVQQPHFMHLRCRAATRWSTLENRYQLYRESAIPYGLNRHLCTKSVLWINQRYAHMKWDLQHKVVGKKGDQAAIASRGLVVSTHLREIGQCWRAEILGNAGLPARFRQDRRKRIGLRVEPVVCLRVSKPRRVSGSRGLMMRYPAAPDKSTASLLLARSRD